MNSSFTTLPAGAPEHALTCSSTALLLIDMQNDFCAKGGYIDTVMGKDVGAADAIRSAVTRLLDAARAGGIPVIWIKADYSFQSIPAAMRKKLQQRGISAVCCEPGTWGADWFCVKPQPGEAIVVKHAYSGFAGTQLDALLRRQNIDTLVFAGVQTQVCVESTVREAHSLGYMPIVAQDAVASHTPALHEASLANIRFLFGDTYPVDTIAAAWARPLSPTPTH